MFPVFNNQEGPRVQLLCSRRGFHSSELISWPTAPSKTDIAFYVVDQTILLGFALKKKKRTKKLGFEGVGGGVWEMNIYLILDICILEYLATGRPYPTPYSG